MPLNSCEGRSSEELIQRLLRVEGSSPGLLSMAMILFEERVTHALVAGTTEPETVDEKLRRHGLISSINYTASQISSENPNMWIDKKGFRHPRGDDNY